MKIFNGYKLNSEKTTVTEQTNVPDKNDENLDAYIDYSTTKVFDSKEIQEVIELCQGYKFRDAMVLNKVVSPSQRRSKIAWLPFPKYDKKTTWIYERMQEISLQLNRDHYGFDLKGAQNLQYAVYDDEYDGFYTAHTDIAVHDKTNIRKLSISVPLSDPTEYEGGAFLLNPGRNECIAMPQPAGEAICFTSWQPHMITPVTKGTRRSLVMWCYGPRFV
jgi:PKHD-type hydroxylase